MSAQPDLQTWLTDLAKYKDRSVRRDLPDLEEDRDYAAVIVDAGQDVSKAGNEMIVLEYRLTENGSKVRQYFTCVSDRAIVMFADLCNALDVDTSGPTNEAFCRLIGSKVTVQLGTYEKGGRTNFSVRSVTA